MNFRVLRARMLCSAAGLAGRERSSPALRPSSKAGREEDCDVDCCKARELDCSKGRQVQGLAAERQLRE
eukprot:CAMPEP_0178438836 /NCGR_PEP_ID=MMETSP0689_2-20121128/35814_1 /TAXON_ID=160604 /ORGANISM="Amphidinium massartii, Strain CS-259" /LENGTH=68 /DNA_ID=CAMNT_0020061283 /DNA_START=436 /DNA_END=639 /DNA_ORIENTATION=-